MAYLAAGSSFFIFGKKFARRLAVSRIVGFAVVMGRRAALGLES